MRLNVLERLLVLGLLPESGNLTTIRIVRKLREALSFNEEDHEVLIFRQAPGGGTSWRRPYDWETFTRYELDDGVQWRMLDGAFTFNGKWSEEKNAEYADRCRALVVDGVEISFGKKARQEVKDLLAKLDKEGKVKEVHYSLYEKFQLVDDLLDDEE